MTTLDPLEVERFSRLASEWWNPKGKMGVLHKFNPVRLAFIRETLCTHFKRDPLSLMPLKGLRILDIGCAAGLVSEPLAFMGAIVVGADPSRANIETAKIHAAQTGAVIDYRNCIAEDLAAAGEMFDVVLAMEVVEHVADRTLFLTTIAGMVKPNGVLFAATLNRTFKSLLFAKIGAEYILGWLPKGTHEFAKFVTPDEMIGDLTKAGLNLIEQKGVIYNPLSDRWLISRDTDVNYMVSMRK